ncbi:MAG TPA: bifunctional folylpolyglutamate synthase/dihydrofolate synthase [Syntrophus sp. (in: bacteria)]|nr:bifunctional folylpolyglutamate synthase/dihydrofolate synthase [Syntrophus sp. (in: bacteria)]
MPMTSPPPPTFPPSFGPAQIRLGLGPIKRLLARLGDPQERYRTVLVAGTNGKGSVSAMVAEILKQGGVRAGLYTSPHLIDFRERIRVGGRPISRAQAQTLIREVREAVTEDVTYFEFLTALAFTHFAREAVPWAVLEVGMGGRLDATNVVRPAVSIISNIALEHRDYLGRSLRDIAREKAGVVKTGGVCLTAATQTAVRDVLAETCRRRRVRLLRLGGEIRIRRHADGSFSYFGPKTALRRLRLALAGRHQQANAALAVGAAEILSERGVPLDEAAIRRGLLNVHWEGRLETLQERPRVVVDGAHNPAGMAALVRSLRTDFSCARLILILGILQDKDYARMIRQTASLDATIIATRPRNERALPAARLAEAAARWHSRVEAVEEPQEALRRALLIAGPHDLVCVAGSLYLIGEIKACFGRVSL